MTDLIAFVSVGGKPTWEHAFRVIDNQEWENIHILCNKEGKNNYKSKKKANFILLDKTKTTEELRDFLLNYFKDKIKGFDVAINMISGDGKEHTALLSALIKLGLGIRIVVLTKEGIKEI